MATPEELQAAIEAQQEADRRFVEEMARQTAEAEAFEASWQGKTS